MQPATMHARIAAHLVIRLVNWLMYMESRQTRIGVVAIAVQPM